MRPGLPEVDDLFHDAGAFYCPGEVGPISRAVHLARLAAFYPACRDCSQRCDTGGLSVSRQAQLYAVEADKPIRKSNRQGPPDETSALIFHDRSYAEIRDAALRLGLEHWDAAGGRGLETGGAILLGGDGRSRTAEPLAAVSEGLRFAGLNVVDVGATTAPCLVHAAAELKACGAVLLAGTDRSARGLALHGWYGDRHRLSLSAGDHWRGDYCSSDHWKCGEQRGFPRRGRQSGAISRRQIDGGYLDRLRGLFHGLRPLRLVVETRCEPALRFLRQLCQDTGCCLVAGRIIASGPSERLAGDNSHLANLGRQVPLDRADFGFWMDAIGESCTLVDERGRVVENEQLTQLLAGERLSVDQDSSPDALYCLALLLTALSRTDRALSAILDGQQQTGQVWPQRTQSSQRSESSAD